MDMRITVSWGREFPSVAQCQGVPGSYRLDSKLRVSNGSATGSVHVLTGGLAGFRLPLTGFLEKDCDYYKLAVSFMPDLSLQRNSTTLLYVDIPKRLRALLLFP